MATIRNTPRQVRNNIGELVYAIIIYYQYRIYVCHDVNITSASSPWSKALLVVDTLNTRLLVNMLFDNGRDWRLATLRGRVITSIVAAAHAGIAARTLIMFGGCRHVGHRRVATCLAILER